MAMLSNLFGVRRNEEIDMEPSVGLTFGDLLTGDTAFCIKQSVYRDWKVWFTGVSLQAGMAPSWV